MLQLMMNFQQLGRPDLAAKESDWLKQYTKAHPAPAGGGANGFPMMPPGAVPTGAVPGGPHPAGVIHVGPSKQPIKPTQ